MTSGERSVLIAESDPELALMLQKALQVEGLRAEVANDGAEAVRKLFVLHPDLFVCGIYLPGLGATRLFRYVRSMPAFSGMTLAAVMPRADRSASARARRAGAEEVFEMPLQPSGFSARVSALLEGRVREGARSIAPGMPPDRTSLLEELTGLLERRLERMEATRDLMLDLSRSPTVREVFRNLAAGILTDLGFDRVQVFQYLPGPGELRIEAALGRGMPGDAPRPMKLSSVEGLPLAIAVRDGRQVRSREVALPEIRLAWAGSMDYVDTPLLDAAGVMGVVRCDFHVTGRSIDPSDLETLQEFCSQASVVLRNSMDLEEISEAREQTRAILGSLGSAVLVIDQGGRTVEASGTGDLMGLEPETLHGRTVSESIPVLARGDRLEMLGRVMLEGRSCLEEGVEIQKPDGSRTIANVRFVPYRHGGRIAGAVILVSDVTEEHTLRENLKQRNDELEMLSRIGRDLNSSLELADICDQLLRSLRLFYPDEAISILLPDEDASAGVPDRLLVKASCGYPREDGLLDRPIMLLGPEETPDPEAPPRRSHPLSGIVGSAFLNRRPFNIPDVSQEPRYVENLTSTRSEIAVPMLIHDKSSGVIDIQSKGRNRFTTDSVRRITTLANHAATAIDNARLHARVWEMAQRDRLTNLRNLRFFEDRIKEELERAVRYNYECSLLMIDVDDFKHYNDHFGHPMGNILLRTLARTISGALRERIDTLVRYGGEEFVCILPLTGGKVAAEIAERIRLMVKEAGTEIPHAVDQPLGCVSVSVGVSTFPTDVPDRDRLLEAADKRMYLAKRAGKNRVTAPALGNCTPGA